MACEFTRLPVERDPDRLAAFRPSRALLFWLAIGAFFLVAFLVASRQ
jgi:hypothetical protein